MASPVFDDARLDLGGTDVRPFGDPRANPGQLELRTRIAHAGNGTSNRSGPLAHRIDPSVARGFDDPLNADAAASNGTALYARDGNETVHSFERAIADLEGTETAYATSSGMAAIALTLLALLNSRTRIVVANGCYHETSELITSVLGRFDVEVVSVAIDDETAIDHALSGNASLLLVETISNPDLHVANLPRLAGLAHDRRALLVVDNTFATPVFCRPIEFGADVVVHSAGKFLAGHSDVTAGVIAGSHALLARIRQTGRLFGATLGAFDAWLALRGLKTLYARMVLSTGSAQTLVDLLNDHPCVQRVRYPGPSAKSARVNAVLAGGGGAILAFDLLGGALAADALVRGLDWIPFAATVGGSSTIISYPPSSRADGANANGISSHACGTVRLSVGLESPMDIWSDLKQALDGLMPYGDIAFHHGVGSIQ